MRRLSQKVLWIGMVVPMAMAIGGVVYADLVYTMQDSICEDPPGGACTTAVTCGPGVLEGIDPVNIRACEDCLTVRCDVFNLQLCFRYYDCDDPDTKWDHYANGCL